MDELHGRFADLDLIPAPRLWGDIEMRAATMDGSASTSRVVVSATGRVRDAAHREVARPSPAWERLAIAGLLLAAALAIVVVGALVTGAARTREPSRLTVAPSVAPSPLANAVVSPAPSSVTSAPCTLGSPPATTRYSTVRLPSFGTDAVYAACSIWFQSIANGGGIERLDLASDRLTATIVPGEVVDSIAASGDAVWAIAQKSIMGTGDSPSLVRIDPTSNRVDDRIALPHGLVVPLSGSDLAIVGQEAWIIGQGADRTGVVPDHAGAISVVDLASRAITSTITLPSAASARFIGMDAANVWVDGGRNDGTGTFFLARVDRATHVVTLLPAPRATSTCLLSTGGLFCAEDNGTVAELSATTGAAIRTTDLATAGEQLLGVDLATEGADVWAMPVLMLPTTAGHYRLESRELVDLDAVSGVIVRRITHTFEQPLAMWSAGGSVWVWPAVGGLVRVTVPLPS